MRSASGPFAGECEQRFWRGACAVGRALLCALAGAVSAAERTRAAAKEAPEFDRKSVMDGV